MPFSVQQLERAGTGKDGLTRWWVDMQPPASYRGRVLAPAEHDAAWVVDQLNVMERQTAVTVTRARLYGPMELPWKTNAELGVR